MKNLITLLKQIEIELRSKDGQIVSSMLWEKLSEVTDWEYRIVQDFILRVRMAIQANDYNFVFKRYEKEANKEFTSFFKTQVDLLIAILKRDQNDIALTDAWNRLLVPSGLSSNVIEIWGYPVTQARNIAVEQALLHKSRYLLFIDDDIVAPNNGLMKLYTVMQKRKALVVSGLYYKKIEPLEAPFENLNGQIKVSTKRTVQKADKICGMGFCLLDIQAITEKVPLPLFWEFGAPDGYWLLGEDAFFTQNLVEYTNKAPLVDTSVKCIHVDKLWKRFYGERDKSVIYASNVVDTLEHFDRMRVPPKYPFILIAIMTRNENDPIAVDLDNLLLYRGYRSELFRVWGLSVDEARSVCAEEAVKRGADYLLFIDDDVIPPKNGLQRLLDIVEDYNAEIVSGNYYLKGPEGISVHTQLDNEGVVTAINRVDGLNGVITSNWLIGLGFCIINVDVFRQARKPWFKCYSKTKEKNVNEDAHFCELALDNGFRIYIDMSIECLHIDFGSKIIYGNYSDSIEYSTFDEVLSSFEIFNFKEN